MTPSTMPVFGNFGRMFPACPAFTPDVNLLKALALKMTELQNPPQSTSIPSGYTILSQFIIHDMTFDKSPLIPTAGESPIKTNFRTARFDLDSVYGNDVPSSIPRDPNDDDILATKHTTNPEPPEDLPRYPSGSAKGSARIPDPRNDENLLICQLHLVFLKLHNVFVQRAKDAGITESDRFAYARQQCQWYYQWIVVNDFLPRFVDKATIDDILVPNGPGETPDINLRFYTPGPDLIPMMPFEFAVAAFRFGHSLIRPAYVVSSSGTGIPLFGSGRNPGLQGGRPIPNTRGIVWPRFVFELPPPSDGKRNHALKIDEHLPSIFRTLPATSLPPGEMGAPILSLPLRDLMRGVRHNLPSGQCVAQAIADEMCGGTVLENSELGLDDAAWGGKAPLWYYVLKEADKLAGGEKLGPVGGRIVAEVILGLLKYDPTCYLNAAPGFEPEPVSTGTLDGTFKLADMLVLAGVAP